jgi:phosphodiesterase/alkaline phosphatase D-like protein
MSTRSFSPSVLSRDAHSAATTCTVEQTARGDVTCDAAAPAWVQHFSAAADGPEQLWINIGHTPDSMVINWATADTSAAATVEYGTSTEYGNTADGFSESYTYSSSYTSPMLHHVELTGLQAATTYYYRVCDTNGLCAESSFKSSPGVGAIYPFVLGSFADVGESDAANDTLTHLLDMTEIDAFVLNGDISYVGGCVPAALAVGTRRWHRAVACVAPIFYSSLYLDGRPRLPLSSLSPPAPPASRPPAARSRAARRGTLSCACSLR